MATFSRHLLSGSTDGKPIPVVATATPGTTIHTAVAGSSAFDEVYVWAANVTALPATLTIEWGGVTDPDEHLIHALEIPANSPAVPVITGQVLNNGLEVAAFSGTASALNLTGYVNRIE